MKYIVAKDTPGLFKNPAYRRSIISRPHRPSKYPKFYTTMISGDKRFMPKRT